MNDYSQSFTPGLDRRRRRRFLTLKNFGIVFALLVILFIAASVISEFRGIGVSDHGRLFDKRVDRLDVDKLPAASALRAEEQVVTTDARGADPMLVEPAAREQYLGVQTTYDLTDYGLQQQDPYGAYEAPRPPGEDWYASQPIDPELAAVGSRRELPKLSGGAFVDHEADAIKSPASEVNKAIREKSGEDEKVVITGGPEGVQLQVIEQ